jgi:hypothetical protein
MYTPQLYRTKCAVPPTRMLLTEDSILYGLEIPDDTSADPRYIQQYFATHIDTTVHASMHPRKPAARTQEARGALGSVTAPTNGDRYHIIFSLSSGVYTQWQSRLVRVPNVFVACLAELAAGAATKPTDTDSSNRTTPPRQPAPIGSYTGG